MYLADILHEIFKISYLRDSQIHPQPIIILKRTFGNTQVDSV